MTDTPKPRSREEQKESMVGLLVSALRSRRGAQFLTDPKVLVEGWLKEVEARALASQGGEPVAWISTGSLEYLAGDASGLPMAGVYRHRAEAWPIALYSHPDPLLAAKEAENERLKSALTEIADMDVTDVSYDPPSVLVIARAALARETPDA